MNRIQYPRQMLEQMFKKSPGGIPQSLIGPDPASNALSENLFTSQFGLQTNPQTPWDSAINTFRKPGSSIMRGLKSPLGLANMGIALAQTNFNDPKSIGNTVGQTVGGALGKSAGSAAGAALGGTLGSVVPVLGTAIGSIAGSALGKAVGGLFGDDKEEEKRKKEEQRMRIETLRNNLQQSAQYLNRGNLAKSAAGGALLGRIA